MKRAIFVVLMLVALVLCMSGCGGENSPPVATSPSSIQNARPTMTITTGDNHSCMVGSNGYLYCWGYNADGQLGINSTTNHSTGQSVSLSYSPVWVSGGTYQTCAATENGYAYCWGGNGYGQLGDSTTTNRLTPVRVGTLSDVIAIDAGFGHTCAVLANSYGDVLCWGLNSYGQIGDNTTTNRSSPALTASYNNGAAIAVAVGDFHTCALLGDGTVWCWGANTYGQLGDGSNTHRHVPVSTGLSNVKAIAASGNSSCALLAGGTVKCWGSNNQGQLGDGTTYDRSTPVAVRSVNGINYLGDVTEIAVGVMHACAVGQGHAYCWGYNYFGQLGNNTTTSSALPVQVSSISDAILIDAGLSHTCVVRADRSSSCWGLGYYGELGNGATTTQYTPVSVDHSGTAMLYDGPILTAGGAHTCAWSKQYSTLKCWGANLFGQVGTGSTSTYEATPISISLSGIVARGVTGGWGMTQVVLADGTMRFWGGNDNCAGGDGTNSLALTPTAVSSIQNAIMGTVGAFHGCALLASGTVECWGTSARGEVGNGDTTGSCTPVAVSDVSNAVAISGGYRSTCALLRNGTIKCWGSNNRGQLGDGTTTNRLTPVTVSNISNAVAVAVGGTHACALLADHTVQCWGGSGDSQGWTGQSYSLGPAPVLGNGTTNDSSTPVSVSGISDAVAVSAGGDFTCVIRVGGTVQCWGYNGSGQLGDGSTTNRSTPVTVSGLSHVVRVVTSLAIDQGGTTGYVQHACAMLDDGSVYCWGGNHGGQLGDGTTTDRTTPVQVSGF